ncbi:MAG: alpha/beta fold hydrolase [Lautropia sp.]
MFALAGLGLPLLLLLGLVGFTLRTARLAERAVPPLGHRVDVPGGAIQALRTGAGPPVLMIHGLGGQMRHFTYALTDRLASSFELIAIDRPGCGWSRRDGDAQARLAEQARMIHAFIVAQGLGRPLVVGHSLGGAVAMQLALDHPDSVSGLALLAPLAMPETEVPPAFRSLAIGSAFLRYVVGYTIAAPIGLRSARAVLSHVFAPNPVPADFPIAGGALLGLRPASFRAATADLMAVSRDMPALAARHHALALPVGILFGDADRILDARVHGEAMRGRIDGLDLEIVPGLGHMVQVSDPDRVAAFVRRIAARAFA